MIKQLSAAFVAVLLGATTALAQIEGQFPAGTVYGNSGASTARPSASTVTGIIDQALGNTRGAILERGASGWTVLAPGTSGKPFISGGAGADPAYGTLGISGGGTNCTAASITCIQNILGTIAQNTILANATGSTASVTAISMPGCTLDGAHALVWTSGSGFTCPGITGGASTILAPQGRLTLETGVPYSTSNQINKSQVFYVCATGNLIPYYTGTSDALDTIPSCSVSTTMVAAASTGQITTTGVFDIWWEGNTNHNICIATTAGGGGGGVGWPSNTARAGGSIAELDKTTRPYITNKNTIAHCYNGSTDYGSIAVNRLTYIGTLYSTAAGQTGMNFRPAAANGGGANVLGLFNAYNRIDVEAYNWDNGGGATWAPSSVTFRHVNNNANNTITYVDGLGASAAFCNYYIATGAGSGSEQYLAGCEINWSSGAPRTIQFGPFGVGGGVTVTQSLPPTLGLNVVSALEATRLGGSIPVFPTCTLWGCTTNTAQFEQLMVRVGGM